MQLNLSFWFTVKYLNKVDCTSGPSFEKKNYEAVPHILCLNDELSDWSNA